ncbi:MAG: hypothetical protein ACHQQS_14825 [Thermoanaerobaculales bacterium]
METQIGAIAGRRGIKTHYQAIEHYHCGGSAGLIGVRQRRRWGIA